MALRLLCKPGYITVQDAAQDLAHTTYKVETLELQYISTGNYRLCINRTHAFKLYDVSTINGTAYVHSSTPATELAVEQAQWARIYSTTIESVAPTLQSVTASGAATTVNLADGDIVALALDASTTLTLTNPTTKVYIFEIEQTTGSKTITWPGTVVWPGGVAPTLSTTAGKKDFVTLVYTGTNFYGTYSLDY